MGVDIELYEVRKVAIFSMGLTYNLATMAKECGLYDVLFQPKEFNLTKAKEAIPFLEKGITELKANPDKYKKFNPENGWGSYENLLNVAEGFLDACRENPESEIQIN